MQLSDELIELRSVADCGSDACFEPIDASE
jgi:hypothetical protein